MEQSRPQILYSVTLLDQSANQPAYLLPSYGPTLSGVKTKHSCPENMKKPGKHDAEKTEPGDAR